MKRLVKKFFLIVFSLALLFNISCSSSISRMILPELNDGKYDSEFPYKNASNELKEITESIKMIHGMAFYKNYKFSKKTKLKKNENRFKHFEDYASEENFFHETYAGTATTIYARNKKALFLTCAHILDFPDTLIYYFHDVLGQRTEYISGVSVKIKQKNYLPELHNTEELKILANDKKNDLALLSGSFEPEEFIHLKTFKYPIGKSHKLSWGTFVYLFGYPLNNKMVTKGIVSPPDISNSPIFYVDANINKGFSGGLVVAIKDGIPNFELVGIVRSGAGKTDYYLKPSNDGNYPLINSKIPYTDNIYVDKNLNLRYGIANVISVETIMKFLKKNRQIIHKADYNFDFLFETSDK